ncbi:MAG TPA: hypothetical protein DCE08_08075, partial [Ruminococcaceae bacterium]|nr:hypothetical protein [Oscillospiraceae bacterium]
MKRLGVALLAAILLLCGCENAQTTSSEKNGSETVSETASKKDNSSKKNTSSWTLNVADYIREIDGEKYFDVSAAAADAPRRPTDDEFFPEADGFVGYYIEKGVYLLDRDTILRVVEYPFKGDGAIKWVDFKPDWIECDDQFDGVLPISRMSDPLYVDMCLPNEEIIDRTNATNMYAVADDYRNALPIAGIALAQGKSLPEDAEITLCFGPIRLYARTKDSDGWFIASDMMAKPVNIYPLPWTLENDENPVHSQRIAEDRITEVDGHYEVKLYGGDFTGASFDDERVESSILHFWGDFYYYDHGTDILGLASSYVVWVKEPEYAGYL